MTWADAGWPEHCPDDIGIGWIVGFVDGACSAMPDDLGGAAVVGTGVMAIYDAMADACRRLAAIRDGGDPAGGS